MSYYMRNGECRFDFPKPVLPQTVITVTDILYTRGSKKGQIHTTRVKMNFNTNDGWVNNHLKVELILWGTDMDMSLLTDASSVIDYVAK